MFHESYRLVCQHYTTKEEKFNLFSKKKRGYFASVAFLWLGTVPFFYVIARSEATWQSPGTIFQTCSVITGNVTGFSPLRMQQKIIKVFLKKFFKMRIIPIDK